MYTITLIPGDHLWTNQATHQCDENGFVKTNTCFQNIQIENKEDYLRLLTIIQHEREKKGLIAYDSTSNLWLLHQPIELPYQVGSFIIPSTMDGYYEVKPNLEKCCQHVGLLADTVCFNPLEYVPKKTPRTKTIKVREPVIHSYSNEIVEEYAIWDDQLQDYKIQRNVTYELHTSNLTKTIETSFVNEQNETIVQQRTIPIVIEKEVTEYIYDPEHPDQILYDIDPSQMVPKYPVKYIASSGIEVSETTYQTDPLNHYCAMYVPYVKLACDCCK